MEKLVAWLKHKEITYLLSSWVNQNWTGENKCNLLSTNIYLDGEKQRHKIIKLFPPTPFFQVQPHSCLPNFSTSSPAVGWIENEGCGETMTVPLCCSFLLVLFPWSSVGPSDGPQFLQRTSTCSGVGSSAGYSVDI